MVYMMLMYVVFEPFLFDVMKAARFEKAQGVVTGFIKDPQDERTYRSLVPTVQFDVGDSVQSFYSTPELRTVVDKGDYVPVIYNPKHMEEAYVYTGAGYWMQHLGYAIPVGLILTLFCFGAQDIPKRWIIKI